jgi:hypothetical protein
MTGYNDTIEIRLEYVKQYRESEENKEHIKKSSEEYREKNRNKLNAYFKSYRQINKKSIKEKTKEKVNCECGCFISKGKLPRYRTTEKHVKLMENCHKLSEIFGKCSQIPKIFGNVWENLGKFGKIGNFWERYLGDIPASEETVTELRRVILAAEQGTSRTDVH